LDHFVFFHILGIIIPTDENIFFRGVGIAPTSWGCLNLVDLPSNGQWKHDDLPVDRGLPNFPDTHLAQVPLPLYVNMWASLFSIGIHFLYSSRTVLLMDK
jgi:hypothetical protein